MYRIKESEKESTLIVSWFLTDEPKECIGKGIVFSKNKWYNNQVSVWGCKCWSHENIYGGWIIKIKAKTVKTLEQNTRKYLSSHEMDKDFFICIKENIMNWTSSQLKSSTVQKIALRKIKNKTRHRLQEIFTVNISNKVFMFKIHKEPL